MQVRVCCLHPAAVYSIVILCDFSVGIFDVPLASSTQQPFCDNGSSKKDSDGDGDEQMDNPELEVSNKMDESYDLLDSLADTSPLSKLKKPSDMIAKEKETFAKPAGKKAPVEEDTPSQTSSCAQKQKQTEKPPVKEGTSLKKGDDRAPSKKKILEEDSLGTSPSDEGIHLFIGLMFFFIVKPICHKTPLLRVITYLFAASDHSTDYILGTQQYQPRNKQRSNAPAKVIHAAEENEKCTDVMPWTQQPSQQHIQQQRSINSAPKTTAILPNNSNVIVL